MGSLIIGPAAVAYAAGGYSAPLFAQALPGTESAGVYVELLSRTDEPSKRVEMFWTQPMACLTTWRGEATWASAFAR